MYKEEFFEEGIVSDVTGGLATVTVLEKGSCEECSAKIFCKPSDDKKKLTAKDTLGVKKGDLVRVAVRGKNVLAAVSMLYGIPLLLILSGIFAGYNYFTKNVELYSSLLGFGLTSVYAAAVYIISRFRKVNDSLIPEIISVTKNYEN